MRRDARGRFVERRAHEYLMRFGADNERVFASTPSRAVALRRHVTLPDTMTDLTAVHDWAANIGRRERVFPTLDRMFPEGWQVVD